MFDRAKIIDATFRSFLSNKTLSDDFSDAIGCDPLKIIDLFESQIISRLLDIKARKLRSLGKSFYTIGSSGHEGMAVVGEISRLTDMAFLHYRDAAFQIHRSKKLCGHTPLHDFLLSFCASSEDPISGGRHKVLGHRELFIPPQTSTIASHLPKAIGAALSINKTKKLGTNAIMPDDAVIICTFGDASLNHASAQAALNCADWISYQNLPLPLIFICEDNGIGISVRTPGEWVKDSRVKSPAIKYFECDGTDVVESLKTVEETFDYSRKTRRPAFLRFRTVRLMGHAGSDIENVYRSHKEIESSEKEDPVLKTAKTLIGNQILTHDQILTMYQELENRIDRVANEVILKPRLTLPQEIVSTVIPDKELRSRPPLPEEHLRKKIFGNEWDNFKTGQTLAKLINWALTDILLQYKEAVVFGEDIARKGGVYNVTANLETRFGKNKVFNSLLDETNILGTAIGLAHNGLLPIPEIQFLAYFHNAEDQLRGEAATLSYFSNGQYTNGMVIRIAGLGYQKGFGGHFHNDNSLTIFRDIPGLVVACPSNGRDAVLMMRACVEEAYRFGRVCVFIEPIALYPVRDLNVPGDGLWNTVYPENLEEKLPIGTFHVEGGERELCLLTYGNGYYLCRQAKEILSNEGIVPTIIDLRWLAPLDEKQLSETLSLYRNVLVVDECRKTGSLSEGLITMMMENCSPLPKIKRICSLDTFIPLADAANLVLVQTNDIIEASKSLLSKKYE
ncbi:MAG: thiamine pyrophosphate-dependent enzyme [Bacteriovoracaceae bacterium]|nr:thiamine pyrophosphate-dependent enzyme [Bacteriovoracaceae bacterium]